MDLKTTPRFLVAHPTGNTYVRNDLRALQEAGQLWRFVTALGTSRDSAWARLPGPWHAEINRRAYDLSGDLIQRVRPAREIMRHVAPRLGWEDLLRHETGWACVDAVYHSLDRAAARLIAQTAGHTNAPNAVLTYEDGAEKTLMAARRAGWLGVYHLPIAYGPYARQLFAEEAQRLPDWAPTLQGDRDSPAKMDRKLRELELADAVVCPSRFVYESLPPSVRQVKPCHIVPYGAPPPPVDPGSDAVRNSLKRPFRLLFMGALSQRKGLADLFAAIKILGNPKNLELILMGKVCAPLDFYRDQGVPFIYEPPRPNEEILDFMAQCDAFVLPSIVEGRAIVQLEALSRGLPLLVTPNAGGDDLITPGETGFLVPIRDPAALAEKINWLLEHRAELPRLRAACRARAAACSWEAYRRRLQSILGSGAESISGQISSNS